MTAVVERLRGLGFELIPEPPDAIRVRWPVGPEPTEARSLLEELRANKAEILATLTASPTSDANRWDDAWERDRLSAAANWTDEEWARTKSWPDAWDWCRRDRPDLVGAVDGALDRIEAAYKRKDVAASIEACRRLQGAVQAAADAYQESKELRPPGLSLDER